MKKIRKGDKIIVIAGKDKGKTGIVLKVINDHSGKILKALVEGVGTVIKHVKPNPSKQIKGGRVEVAMPIDISNIAIFNELTNKADKIGFKINDAGEKYRYYKSNGEEVRTQ